MESFFDYSYMKYLLSFLFLILGLTVNAQRNTQQSIDATSLKTIQINSDEVFLITIHAAKSNVVSIKTHSEGEYFNNIILTSEVDGDILKLASEYPERLAGGFDKLSAHKVFSLEVELTIPENMNVEIRSNIASLTADGNFKRLFADLNQGYCQLSDFDGQALINTYKGNITVVTNSGNIDAHSRHGKVETPGFLAGRNPIKLTSIDGNITVRKN